MAVSLQLTDYFNRTSENLLIVRRIFETTVYL